MVDMGIEEGRESEELGTRERILEAARELFIAEGYDGVSMRKISGKIEYSPTTIYAYFHDKDELFREICHEDFRRLAHSLIGLAQVTDPVERIKKIGLAYIEFGQKHPNHYRTMFMTPHPPILEEGAALAGKGNPEEDAYEFLRATVKEAMAAGVFREHLNDPDLVAQTLWAGAHGVISLYIAKCNDDWVPWRSLKKRTETMLDGMLQGLLKEK
jgi:AcrR family transcriptional regulator